MPRYRKMVLEDHEGCSHGVRMEDPDKDGIIEQIKREILLHNRDLDTRLATGETLTYESMEKGNSLQKRLKDRMSELYIQGGD